MSPGSPPPVAAYAPGGRDPAHRVTGRMGNHERSGRRGLGRVLPGQRSGDADFGRPAGRHGQCRWQEPFASKAPGPRASRWRAAGGWHAAGAEGFGKSTGGFRIRPRGADVPVFVAARAQADLALLMPEKLPPTRRAGCCARCRAGGEDRTSRSARRCRRARRCAPSRRMKMENILRSERKAVVSKGQCGARWTAWRVDDVILEFE